MKLKLSLISIVFCGLAVSVFAANPQLSNSTSVSSGNIQQSKEKLQALNWDKFNKSQLDKMMAQYGKDSPGYDPAHPPYAVFDWDNTSIFLDIQEAVLSYLLVPM